MHSVFNEANICHPTVNSLQAAFDLLPDAVFSVDRATMTVVEANRLACAALGFAPGELRGVKLDDLCPSQDVAALVHRMDGPNGDDPMVAILRTTLHGRDRRETPVEWRVSRVREATAERWVVVSRELVANVTPDARAESFGLGLPGHDPLTGLPDRRLFERRLTRAFEESLRSESYRFAVCFIDLDGFKAVNDRFGHLIGDRALCEAARRLVGCVRPSDMAARFGGDEFTVFLDELRDESNAAAVARRILEQLEMPLAINGADVRLGASVGVAARSADCRGVEDLLHRADRAMYRAKSLGGGQVFVV